MITASVTGDLTLRQQLRFLSLTQKRRRALNQRLIRQVVKFSRQRMKRETDLNGQGWEPRRKRRRRPRKLMQQRNLKEYVTPDIGRVSWKNGLMGLIASQQQHGQQITMTAEKLNKANQNYDAPATKHQAHALREEGFRVKRQSGRGNKKPSISWIISNLTIGQAGFALRRIRAWRGERSKQSWNIDRPPRSFLGVTRQEQQQLADEFISEMMSNVRQRRR